MAPLWPPLGAIKQSWRPSSPSYAGAPTLIFLLRPLTTITSLTMNVAQFHNDLGYVAVGGTTIYCLLGVYLPECMMGPQFFTIATKFSHLLHALLQGTERSKERKC